MIAAGDLGGAGREILVVDDEPTMARALSRQLQHLGWNPTAVGHAPHALELVTAQPRRFAAMITDHTMPVMSGVELAHRLGVLGASPPIVLSTGLGDEDAFRHPTIAAVLHKPYDRLALAGALARVTARPTA